MSPEPNTPPAEASEAPPPTPPRGIIRFLPIAIIALAAAAAFASGATRYLNFDAIRDNHAALSAFVAANFAAALALYMLAYVAATSLSLPGATLLSLLGGFLFGPVIGTIAVVVAATFGAGVIFLAARTAFGDLLRAKAGPFLARMEKGFTENAFSYLLLLRLIPVFPFFIVNIAPAFAKVSLRTFLAATFIGIIPGAFAFVSAGAGLGAVLAQGGEASLKGLLLQPAVLIPIAALSLLALLPIVLKALKRMPAETGA